MFNMSDEDVVVDLLKPNYLAIGIFMFIWYYVTLIPYLSVLWVGYDFPRVG